MLPIRESTSHYRTWIAAIIHLVNKLILLTGPGATGPGLKDPSLSPDHEPKDIGSAKANFAPDQHNGPQLTRRGQSSTASPSDYSRKLDPFVWIDRVIFQYSHAGLPIYHIVDTMARFVSGWVWPKKSEEDADPGVDSKNEVNQELYRRFEELQRNRTETMRLEDWNIRVVWINRTGQVWPWLSRSQKTPFRCERRAGGRRRIRTQPFPPLGGQTFFL